MPNDSPDLRAAYLKDLARTFRNYQALGERAIAQAPDGDLHTELDRNSNSIAVVVKHVSGNLRSRFRDFLTTDGTSVQKNVYKAGGPFKELVDYSGSAPISSVVIHASGQVIIDNVHHTYPN